MELFISNLFSDNAADRFYFLAVALTVVISIVLHELAHGWAAIRLGDYTPMRLGRMTGNPMVHMGPYSLVVLALVGIAWGRMPIDPTRLKGRHAEAMVSGAGPAVNLILALLALTAMALMLRAWDLSALHPLLFFYGTPEVAELVEPWQFSALRFMAIAGVYNLLLAIFNLIPVPPLDGSHIVGSYVRPYAEFVGNPRHQGFMLMIFVFGFFLVGQVLTPWAIAGMNFWVGLLT